MEDIERLMMNETEHYDTAYKVGKREGISLGISQEKNKMAKSMLNENIDINIVSKITGLTYEQISSL